MSDECPRDPVDVDYAALELEETEYADGESERRSVGATLASPDSCPESPATKDKPSKTGATTGGRAKKELTTEQLEQLLKFDREIILTPRKKPVEVVIGTDEVGRGCLAGPVMAAAVVLPDIDPKSELAWQLARLNDSKQVHPTVRAELSVVLRSICQYAIGEASVEEIDEINILQASLLAMKRAIRRLRVVSPAVILVDGNKKIGLIKNMQQETVIDGDTKSASIAAASIIAKVHRDTFMTKLARKFPHYRWESNKGYRSRDHWDAINQHGMCEWHRKSFVAHWLEEDEDESNG